MKKKSALWTLFFSTLYLSAFTFGGGYVIVSLMKKKFVDEYHWIEEDEMLDLIAIAQSAPGAIAVNGAIVVGYKLAGLPGALLLVNAFWDGGAGDACRDKLDDAAAFCRLLAAAAQNKAEPNSDNGTRGSHQCREICFGRIAGSGKSD